MAPESAAKQQSCAWILLRGLTRESGHWGPFADQFAAKVPNDQVITLDLPGTGSRLNEVSPRTIDGIYRAVRAEAFKRLAPGQPIKLLAVSLGAMVAAEWVRQSPQELSGCILINTSSRLYSPFYHRLRWQVWQDFIRILTIQVVREREKQIIALLFNNTTAREVALPLWTKIATERPVSYGNFFRQILAASSYKGFSESSKVPMLLLNGLGDRLVDPSCSTRIHKKLNWPIHRHPWAGHDLPWDDPEWVIEKIHGWNSTLASS